MRQRPVLNSPSTQNHIRFDPTADAKRYPGNEMITIGAYSLSLPPLRSSQNNDSSGTSLRQQRHRRHADGEKNEYTKLGIDEVKETIIPFPVNSQGEYDSEEQERIANRYSQLLEMRRKVLKDLDTLDQIDVSFAI